MSSYDLADADDFFGRERAVGDCLDRLAASGFVAIVGPSGCGKSSVARAGVGRGLQRATRPVACITPGGRPTDALQAAPNGAALVVDQLEELFTLCDDAADRARFVALLEQRATAVPVVVTLRSDHLASITELPWLACRVEAGLFLLRPMDDDDLRAAIEGPATRAGLRLEPGLVDLLIHDVADQPGALPLLSHALAELWSRRDGRVLTAAAYRQVGGVRGAVGQTAEEAIEGLPPDGRRIARDLFLRLVTVSDGEPIRQRLPRRDLAGDLSHATVLDALARARLLTVDETTVQVAHEALARAWPRLQTWLDEDREGQRIRLHLTTSASGWEVGGRDDGELYRGARLRAAEEWVASTRPTLTRHEREFLDASTARRRAEEEDLVARAAAQFRLNRRLRRSLIGVGVGLALALVAVAAALDQRGEARGNARQANLQTVLARSEALQTAKRDLSALLAVAAYRLDPGPASRGALLGVFTAAPGAVSTIPIEGAGGIEGIAVWSGVPLPDGDFALTGRTDEITVVDGTDGQVQRLFPPPREGNRRLTGLAASADGAAIGLVTSADNEPILTVWDLARGDRRFEDVNLASEMESVAFSPDGGLLALGGGADGRVDLRSSTDGRLLRTIPGLGRLAPPTDTAAVGFLPDGTLAITSQRGPLRIVDPVSGEERLRLEGPENTSSQDLLVSPDGRRLYALGVAGGSAFDLDAGRWLWTNPTLECNAMAVAEEIGGLLCGRLDGLVTAFDLDDGHELAIRFEHHFGPVAAMAVTDDGSVLTVAGGTAVSTWRLDGGGAVSHVALTGGEIVPEAYLDNGALLVRTLQPPGAPGDYDLVDPETGAALDDLDGIVGAVRGLRPHSLAAIFIDFEHGIAQVEEGSYDVERHARTVSVQRTSLGGPAIGARASREVLVVWSENAIQGVDADGRLVPPRAQIPGGVAWVEVTADGSHIFTLEPEGLVPRSSSGEAIGDPLPGIYEAVAATEVVVVADVAGRLAVLDPDTLEPSGPALPATRGVERLLLSHDEQTLLMTEVGGNVRLADLPSRRFLGGPIVRDIGQPFDLAVVRAVAIRDDGEQVAIATASGIVVWDLEPAHLVEAACRLAGRDLTEAEWRDHLGWLGQYRPVC